MASATRPPGAPQPVLRFRSIATSVSRQAEGELFYRGRALADVVALGSLEEAAAVVLEAPASPNTSAPDATAGLDLALLPLHRRMPVAVQLLAAADPFAADTDPERVRAAALLTLRAAVALVAGRAPGPTGGDDLAALALGALGGRPDAPGDLDVLRVLLVS